MSISASRFASLIVRPGKRIVLGNVDAEETLGWSEQQAKRRLDELQSRLGKLQSLFFADARYALLVVLQGMDTSGKDGTIRNVMERISPLGVQVKAFKAPAGDETRHDFLWRVHQAVPGRGSIGIFNRSHYEDFLYPSVFGGLPPSQLGQRLNAINHFEEMLHYEKILTLKFFLHISKAQQKKRLEARLSDPTKQWKFASEDLTSRKKWATYMKSYETVLNRTSTRACPWVIVPADSKWFRNLVVADFIVHQLESLNLRFPRNGLNIKRIRIP